MRPSWSLGQKENECEEGEEIVDVVGKALPPRGGRAGKVLSLV